MLGGPGEHRGESCARVGGLAEAQSSCNGRSPGGEWALGVGLALANHRPRCSRVLRIISGFSIIAMKRISFLQRGQTKGETSQTF